MRHQILPRPLLIGDEETIQIGIKLANEIARYVYAPMRDTPIPEPLKCSPCLTPKETHE